MSTPVTSLVRVAKADAHKAATFALVWVEEQRQEARAEEIQRALRNETVWYLKWGWFPFRRKLTLEEATHKVDHPYRDDWGWTVYGWWKIQCWGDEGWAERLLKAIEVSSTDELYLNLEDAKEVSTFLRIQSARAQ